MEGAVMPIATTPPRAIVVKAYGLGILAAGCVMAILLCSSRVTGTASPSSPQTSHFSVAVLAGPKQAAQSAPDNTDKVVTEVTATPEPISVPIVAAQRETSLPDAVKAAQESVPEKEPLTKPVEVLPPTNVAMPGGHLTAVDEPIGNSVGDPFSVKPRQVYIRLLVNASGQVVRFGVIRSGGDSLRDGLILKAMRSRTYATDKLIRVPGNEPLWQLDMVLDYGNNEFLP